MCRINYTIEEIVNHPKLSDDYKFDLVEGIIVEEFVSDWLDEQEQIGISLEELGLTIDDLNDFYDLDESDYTDQVEKFATSKIIPLYRYFGKISDNSRRFCRTLVTRTNASLMRKQDIEALNSSNPGLGKGGSDTYSVFNWRGGANCKHKWVKYFYNQDTMNLVKSPEQPTQVEVNGKVPYANGTNTPPPRKNK